MKTVLWASSALVLFGLSFWLLVGNVAIDNSKELSTKNRQKVLVPGTLTNLNLLEQVHPLIWDLRPLVFRTLLSWDEASAELRPNLAQSWTRDNDEIKFTLTESIRWSDGRPITSEDIEFSLGLQASDESRSVYQSLFKEIIGEFKIIDEKSFLIRTKTPSYYHLLSLGLQLPIFPKHIYEGENGQIQKPNQWLGSGEFVLESFVPDRRLLFVNEKEELLVEFLPSLNLRQHEVLKGRANWAKLNFVEGVRLKLEGEKRLFREELGPRSGVVWLLLNHKNSHLAKTSVRKALMYGFDREKVNQLLTDGELKKGQSFWPSTHPYSSSSAKKYSFSPKRAHELLHKADYRDRDGDGYLEDQNGIELAFEVLVFSDEDARWVELFSQYMNRLGIRVNIERQGEQEVYRRMSEGQYDASLIKMPSFYKDLNLRFQFHSERRQKWPLFSFSTNNQKRLDEWLESIELEQDIDQRKKLHQNVDRILNDELPHLFLYELPHRYWLKAEGVEGVPPF